MSKRTLRALIAVFGLLTSVMTCVAPAAAQQKVTVTHPTDSLAAVPMYVARAMDYFKSVGLDAEFIRSGSGPKSLAAMVSGGADIYVGATQAVLKAREEGVDAVLFDAIMTQYTSTLVVSKEWADKNNITAAMPAAKKAAALKGARIGANAGGSELIVRYIARLAGLNPDRDMTIAVMGGDSADMLAALSAGRIDGYSMSPPASQVGVKQYGAAILLNTPIGEVDELNGYFFIGASAMKSWLDAHQDIAGKFNKAIQMALETLKDPAKSTVARDKVHQQFYSSIDKDVFDLAWSDIAKGAPSSIHISRAMMDNVVKLSKDIGGSQLKESVIDGSYINIPPP